MAMSAYRDAISRIESGGRYNIVGPTHPKLGRALGKYQVMEANVGPWTEKHLGRRMTPEEFLASPAAQDAVFDGEFGTYVQQYGPEGAAQAWFGGPGGVGKTGRKDSLGTSVGKYGQMFMNSLGQSGPSLTPEQRQFVQNNPQPGGFGPEVEQMMAPFGSMAPGGSPFAIPPGVADYANSPEPMSFGDRLSGLGEGLSAAMSGIKAPRPSPHPGGPSGEQATALTKWMQNPQAIMQAFLQKRLA